MKYKHWLWIPLFFGVLVSCENPALSNGTLTFTIACFPHDMYLSSYQLSIETYSATSTSVNMLDKFDLGTVTPDSAAVVKKYAINPGATDVGIYLTGLYTDVPSYFMEFKLKDISKGKVDTSYWLDYERYINNEIRFGLNDAYIQDMQQNTPYYLDFHDAPLYFLRLANEGTGYYQVSTQVDKGTMHFEDSYSPDYFWSTTRFRPTATTQSSQQTYNGDHYFLIDALDYNVDNALEIEADNVTDQVNFVQSQTFGLNEVQSVNDQDLYMVKMTPYDTTELEYRSLRKWHVSNGNVTTTHVFDHAITAMTHDSNTVFVATGLQLYAVDTTDDTATLLHTFPNSVRALCAAGEYLFAQDDQNNNHVLQRSDDQEISSGASPFLMNRSMVFMADHQKIYMVQGNYSNNVGFIDLDPSSTNFCSASAATTGLDIGSKLIRIGTQDKILSNTGEIFAVNGAGDGTASLETDIGDGFVDAVSLPGRIVILRTGGGQTSLVSLSDTSPYSEISSKVISTTDNPLALVPSSTGVILVTGDDGGHPDSARAQVLGYTIAELDAAAKISGPSPDIRSFVQRSHQVLPKPLYLRKN